MNKKFYIEGGVELKARYDSANSFYKKAYVLWEGSQTVSLFSYGSKICTIETDETGCIAEVTVYNIIDDLGDNLTYSSTSLRHLKEFLKQQGIEATSKEQIMKDYEQKEVYI